MKKLLVILLLTSLVSLESCRSVRNLKSLSKCEFAFDRVSNIFFTGIDISAKKSFSDLGFGDVANLYSAFSKGALPLNLIASVKVKNPNKVDAALGRLDWIAFIDDLQIADGSVYERVAVPANNGVATIPVAIKTDLYQLMKGQGKMTILNFAFNLAGMGGKPTRITLKVKPYIKIGKKSIAYPGYFKVRETFGAE